MDWGMIGIAMVFFGFAATALFNRHLQLRRAKD